MLGTVTVSSSRSIVPLSLLTVLAWPALVHVQEQTSGNEARWHYFHPSVRVAFGVNIGESSVSQLLTSQLDVRLGLSLFRHVEPPAVGRLGMLLRPEIGYTWTGLRSDVHLAAVGLGLGLGTDSVECNAVLSGLVGGGSSGLAFGGRAAARFELGGSAGGIEVGYQYLHTMDTDVHQLVLMVSIDLGFIGVATSLWSNLIEN
jgi:hypothetical protein